MTGAALMVVVALKLFVIDLSHVSGIERIVSFIGVGC
jgi:Predicted membrane protein